MPSRDRFSIATRSTLLIGLALLVVSSAQGGEQQPKFLTDTNFFGKDIRDFDLPEENPQLCYQACVEEKSCHAFTYLRPHGWAGAGPTAHCWLKYGVSSDVRHEPCCVAGVVRPGEDSPPPLPPNAGPDPKPNPEPQPRPEPFRVTDVKLDAFPSSYRGSCPVTIQYLAVIAGSGPGTAYYVLSHRGDTIGDPIQLKFERAGSKEIRVTREAGILGAHEDLHEELRIMRSYRPGGMHCDPAACRPQWQIEKSVEITTPLDCSENPTTR